MKLEEVPARGNAKLSRSTENSLITSLNDSNSPLFGNPKELNSLKGKLKDSKLLNLATEVKEIFNETAPLKDSYKESSNTCRITIEFTISSLRHITFVVKRMKKSEPKTQSILESGKELTREYEAKCKLLAPKYSKSAVSLSLVELEKILLERYLVAEKKKIKTDSPLISIIPKRREHQSIRMKCYQNFNESQSANNRRKQNMRNLNLSYDISSLKIKSALIKQNPHFLQETKSFHRQKERLSRVDSHALKESTTQTLPIVKERRKVLLSTKIYLTSICTKNTPKLHNDAFKSRIAIKKAKKPRSLNKAERYKFPSLLLQEISPMRQCGTELRPNAARKFLNAGAYVCTANSPILSVRSSQENGEKWKLTQQRLMELVAGKGQDVEKRLTPKLVKRPISKFDRTKQLYVSNVLFDSN
eukprot:TRINITY_DN3222_c0_g3_i4.p1 TRINITY_DN3222_c0_g3~~TRINITY_DN3222_c0_g3_i4.p1  ORF type:complete len:417 (-),score=56.68 TRINITY_DN3222_c0_g3_i4:145-1395(-)